MENGKNKGIFSLAEIARILSLKSSGQVPQQPAARQGFARLGETPVGQGFRTLTMHSEPAHAVQQEKQPSGSGNGMTITDEPGQPLTVQIGPSAKRGK